MSWCGGGDQTRPRSCGACGRPRDRPWCRATGRSFAGLRALGHLDLNFAGVDEVLARHTEAAGGHLLDGGILGVAVVQREEAVGILAAFTGVGLATDAIHRDRQRLVRFLRDGAIGHGARLERCMIDSTDSTSSIGMESPALKSSRPRRGAVIAGLVVDEFGVLLEDRVAARAHRLLQAMNRLGIEEVILTLVTPLVLAARRQHIVMRQLLGEGRVVTERTSWAMTSRPMPPTRRGRPG